MQLPWSQDLPDGQDNMLSYVGMLLGSWGDTHMDEGMRKRLQVLN